MNRFSASATITNKHPNTVINYFLKQWLSLFGTPNSIYSDNGGKFVSKDAVDFCENFNIKINTTPTELPWSNRICECHTEILLKVKKMEKKKQH